MEQAETQIEKQVELKIVTRDREPMTESFSFRTTREEAERIKQKAEELKITTSDLVRSSLTTTKLI